jgi:cation:H+ antiporter
VVRREAPLAVAAMAVFAVLAGVGLGPVAGALLALATVAALVLLVRLARSARTLCWRRRSPSSSASRRATPSRGRWLVPLWAWPVSWPERNCWSSTLPGSPPTSASRRSSSGSPSSRPARLYQSWSPASRPSGGANPDLLVGNLLGSNMFNSLAGGAVVGLAAGHHGMSVRWPLLAAMVLVGLVAWALLARGRRLTRAEGLLLLVVYASTLPLLL